LNEHHDMAEAAFHHYDNLLGTKVAREHTIELES